MWLKIISATWEIEPTTLAPTAKHTCNTCVVFLLKLHVWYFYLNYMCDIYLYYMYGLLVLHLVFYLYYMCGVLIVLYVVFYLYYM